MIAGSIEIELFARIARLQNDMTQARQVVTRATDGMERAANSAKAALAGIAAGIGMSQLIQMSDGYAKFTAQLRLASLSAREYATAYGDVKRIATQSTQELQTTGVLYAKIANGTRELGVAQKQVSAITETVNLSLLVSGATASEAASAQLQLSQAFASGTLRGEEFNAVNEAAPRLMLALADGMGVPVGALKKMAEEGKITSKIMADVLPNALTKLREEAKEIQTIGGAFTVLKNNMMEFVGIQSNASGAVSALTGAIGFLANNLTLIAGAVATLTTAKLASWLASMIISTYSAVTANRALATSTLASAVATTEAAAITSAAKLAEAQANVRGTASAMMLANARVTELRAAVLATSGATSLAIATNGLIPAQARAIALAEANAAALAAQAVAGNAATVAANASTAALGAQAAAATIGARAMGLLRGAIGFLGGPIGAVITLLGLAATAWMVWGDKAKEGNDKAVKSTDESTTEMIARLDKHIEKLRERNRLAETEPRIKGLGEMSDADKDGLARAKAALDANRASAGGLYDHMFSKRRMEETTLALNYETALKRVGQAQDEATAAAKRTRDADIAEWYAKHGNNTQKLAAELDELRKKFGAIPAEMEKMVRAKYADKGAAAAIKQEATAYQSLVASIGEKIAANKLEMSGYDKLTDAQKMTIKLDESIAAGKNKLTPKHIAEARAMIETVDAQDKALLAKKQAVEMDQIRIGYGAALGKSIEDAVKEAEANELLVRAFGKTRAAIEQLEIARMEERLGKLRGIDMADDEVAALERLIEVKRRNAAAVVKLEVLDTGSDATKAKELLDILTTIDAATKSAASGMAESFGKVGSAIGGLTVALSEYAAQQQAIMAQLAAAKADPKNGPDKIAKLEIVAAHASTQAKIKSYGDMASAGKAFFKENTKGYKVMEGAEKAFRAYEMTMAVQSMVKKIFFKEGEVAANLALNGTKLAGEATSTAASTGLAATESSAWGITAVVKAMASLPFPANLAAGAATLAAVVAIGAKMIGGIGGAGKVDVAKERQAAAGTGSVFGDSSAKSESIKRAIELSANNSSTELNYTAAMLRSLLAIQSSLSGLGNLLVRSGDVGGALPGNQQGTASKVGTVLAGGGGLAGLVVAGPLFAALDKILGGWISKTTGKIANAIFGGNVSTLDGGVTAAKTTVGGVKSGGLAASSYVDTKKDGGWFGSDKYRTALTGLGTEANDQFTKVIQNMASAVTEAGKLLGFGGDAFTQRLNAFVVDIGKISTKDLKPEEIQAQLEAVFSKVGDDMSRWAVQGLAPFQQVGEGYLETLVRVASNYANLDAVLNSVGMTFGAVGLASIAAREDLIAAAGGMDALAGKFAAFSEDFLTEAQRLAPVQKYVTDQLAAMGLASLTSRDAFAAHLLALDPAVEAERKQIAALLDLAPAFAKVNAQTKDLTKSQQAIADERADLQNQLDEMTMSSIQLLNKQRMALDASNRGLFDQIQSAKAAKAAQEAAMTSLGDVISKMQSFGDSARALSSGLVTGSLSTLTPEQQYAELERQYQTTRVAGIAGDTKAQANFASIAQAYLTASQKINGGDARYSTDFAGVLRDSEEIAKWTTAQVDVAQASLDAMNAQVAGIATLNATMLLVAEGVGAMPSSAIPGPDYSRMGTSDKDALVAEVRALRASNEALVTEVKGLRTEQRTQTGDTISGIATAVARGAEKVVDGLDDVSTNARSSNYKVSLHDF